MKLAQPACSPLAPDAAGLLSAPNHHSSQRKFLACPALCVKTVFIQTNAERVLHTYAGLWNFKGKSDKYQLEANCARSRNSIRFS